MKLKMFNGSIISLIFLITFILFQACNSASIEQNKSTSDSTGERLIKANKYLIDRDQTLIKAYITRHGYKMKQTESGLFYQVLKEGHGQPVKPGNSVMVKYKLELPDGTLCYDSDSLGTKKFSVGSGTVEAGLDEGIQMLKQGDVACLILMPHLGYGLAGDNKRIPPRSILIYSIEVLVVK